MVRILMRIGTLLTIFSLLLAWISKILDDPIAAAMIILIAAVTLIGSIGFEGRGSVSR